jgi:hypothetical protein
MIFTFGVDRCTMVAMIKAIRTLIQSIIMIPAREYVVVRTK